MDFITPIKYIEPNEYSAKDAERDRYEDFLYETKRKLTDKRASITLENNEWKDVSERFDVDYTITHEGKINPHEPLVVMFGGGFGNKDAMLPVVGELLKGVTSGYNILGVPHFPDSDVTEINPDGKTKLLSSYPPSAYAENRLTGQLAHNLLTERNIPGYEGKTMLEQTTGPLVLVGQSNGALAAAELLKLYKADLDQRFERATTAQEVAKLIIERDRKIVYIGVNPAGTYDEAPFKDRRKTSMMHLAFNFLNNASFPELLGRTPDKWLPDFRKIFLNGKNSIPMKRMLEICAIDRLVNKLAPFTDKSGVSINLLFGRKDTVFQEHLTRLTNSDLYPNVRIKIISGAHQDYLFPGVNKEVADSIVTAVNRPSTHNIKDILGDLGTK
ncbi:hypothetical protein KBD45_01010 [Candidatus Dojkabacteria bacterium]|nr:hypothetical protein [Candidatus Dojkabacteria bacterium]